MGFLAAAKALEGAYAALRDTGSPPAESYGFGRICELMGFPEVWEFERRWAQPVPMKDAAE